MLKGSDGWWTHPEGIIASLKNRPNEFTVVIPSLIRGSFVLGSLSNLILP